MEQKTKIIISILFGIIGAIGGYILSGLTIGLGCGDLFGTIEEQNACYASAPMLNTVYTILGFLIFFIITYLLILLGIYLKQKLNNN